MAAEPGGPGQPSAEPTEPMDVVAATTPDGAEPRPPSFPMPSQMMAEMWSFKARFSSVPMPDHEALAHLQSLHPQAAEIIFGQMIAQSNHRMELEKAVTQTNNTLALRGQIIGGFIGWSGLMGSLVVIANGYPAYGVAVATGCVTAIVSIFVLGKRSQQQEKAGKAEIRDKIANGKSPESIEQPPSKPAGSNRPKPPQKSKKQDKPASR